MLDDAEMLVRLRYIYGGKRVDDIAEEWARMRRNGLDNLVDERKRRYCRRMYNLSQYLKTLKEMYFRLRVGKKSNRVGKWRISLVC